MILSYSSQLCVLEHMEVNQRLIFAARCPSMKTGERSVPIHIRHFLLGNYYIALNNITYDFQTFTEEGLQITFMYRNKKLYRQIPAKHETVQSAMIVLSNLVLDGRPKIKIRLADFLLEHPRFSTIPMNVQFHMNEFHVESVDVFNFIRPILHPSSPAAKYIGISVWLESHYKESIILNAESLRLQPEHHLKESVFWHDVLMRLKNKRVELESVKLTGRHIRAIVKAWIENGRAIGSRYTMECSGKTFLKRQLKKIQERFQGSHVAMKKYDRSRPIIFKIVSVPLNSVSEIIVYGTVDNEREENEKIMIHIEVIAIDFTIPVEKKTGFKIPWFSRIRY